MNDESDVIRLSVSDVAKWLGVSVGTIRRWCDQGLIPYYKLPSGQRRFNAQEVDAWVRDRQR